MDSGIKRWVGVLSKTGRCGRELLTNRNNIRKTSAFNGFGIVFTKSQLSFESGLSYGVGPPSTYRALGSVECCSAPTVHSPLLY